jgi:hypothetical protein
MDSATIFVLFLAAGFLGFIAYMAVISRRNAAKAQPQNETQRDVRRSRAS